MKRNQALAPLSRDHHVALTVARELSRATPDRAEQAARRFVRFLAHHELAHFVLEESVLLPALSAGEPGLSLARQVREDHRFLRDAMHGLGDSAGAANVELLHAIGERLRAHVRLEERELFPQLERSLDEASLRKLGRRLSHSDAPGRAGIDGRVA